MAKRRKSAVHDLRRSPRFEKQNDLRVNFKNPNLKSANVSRRSPRVGKLTDTNSVQDLKTPNLESVRKEARLSATDRSLMSPPSCGDVMGNEVAEEVKQNEAVRKSELRRSPRFGKSCVEQIIGLNSGDSEKKLGADANGEQENTGKERVCLRRSPRFSNQERNYKDADWKLDSVVDKICDNDGGKSNRSVKKNIRKSNNPIGLNEESAQMGEEASRKNEGKGAEAGRSKRKRAKEGSEVVRGWTKEQETALERAYMSMKPTPRFWKKVSKMVNSFFLGRIVCLPVFVFVFVL